MQCLNCKFSFMEPLQKLEVIEMLKIKILSLYFLWFHVSIMPFVLLPVPQECYVLMPKVPSEFL